ncbi:MAG: hypothetical protein LBL90_08395 [Prevotellaceae bacterium]|jgi:hypothetical protein|nr:hypothetical protein [Prevotellaceae bacterium]
MKKVKLLGLSSLLIVVIFTGCGRKQANAENMEQAVEKQEEMLPAKKHFIVKLEESIGEQIVAKNYRKAYDAMIANGDMAGIDESQLKAASDFFVRQMQNTFGKNSGVVEYRVENIEVDDNAKTVDLITTIVYQNGKTETKPVRYFNRNGGWKRGIAWNN